MMEYVTDPVINERAHLWLGFLIKRYPVVASCQEAIFQAFLTLKNTFRAGGKLMVCGNGGSAADAEHICTELMKGFLKKRSLPEEIHSNLKKVTVANQQNGWISLLQGALPALPLTTNDSLTTAIGNDQAADLIFAQQIIAIGKKDDVLLAISTSGSSPNVIKALIVAKALQIKTIGLTGSAGGKFKEICDLTILAPAARVYQIQELHLPIYHTLCAMLEEEFF
jgi:D-sedoheptulose 7-phosphate isomerase